MTESQPKPYSRKLFDKPTVYALGALALGIVLLLAATLLTSLLKLLGFVVIVGAVGYLTWYSGREVVRWYQEDRRNPRQD